MRPGREVDTRIAREVFGHEVWATNRTLHEKTELGKRPLRNFSNEMEWAWEVAEKMRITLVPVKGGQWFAFACEMEGWDSPEEFARFLQKGDFSGCGASVGANPALAICEAALRVMDKRTQAGQQPLHLVPPTELTQ